MDKLRAILKQGYSVELRGDSEILYHIHIKSCGNSPRLRGEVEREGAVLEELIERAYIDLDEREANRGLAVLNEKFKRVEDLSLKEKTEFVKDVEKNGVSEVADKYGVAD